jgi:hypothetical protein
MAGAGPSFTEVHVLRALLMLYAGTHGRKSLVQLLGVGEGSVRTIMKRLAADGLLASSRRGHTLTDSGRASAEAKLARMSMPKAFDSGGMVGGFQSLVVVYGAADRVGAGATLRDAAVKTGADGAVILVYKGGLMFPDGAMDLGGYPRASAELSKIPIREGDAVVIGFGASPQKAEDGAVTVSLRILGEA